MHENKPSLVRGAIFADSRCHTVFNDGSALITHPSGDCFTYFYANGKKERQLIPFATSKGGIRQKLIDSISYFNTYTDCPITYPHVLDGTIPKLSRIERVHWEYPSVSPENLFKDPEGNVVFKDFSHECTLKLNANGLFFEVEFQSLIPSKRPYFVNVVEGGHNSQGVIQLCYEYAKISQIHSLQQYPHRWALPLEVAWNYFWSDRQDSPTVFPTFDTSTHQYACKGEIATDLPSGSKNVSSDTNKTEGIGVWLHDDVSPATDFLKYHEPLKMLWDQKAVYRRINKTDIEVLVFKDRSVILVKDTGTFYYHIAQNSSEDEMSCIRRFTRSSVPLRIRNPLMNSYCLDDKKIGSLRWGKLWHRLDKLREDTLEEDKRSIIENLGEFISYKNKSIKCTFCDRTIVRAKLGAQTAVILTKEGERIVVSVENPRGYEEYMKVCMEFMDFAFTPIHERERREQEKQEQQMKIEAEISKIQRTLGIIKNRVPTENIGPMLDYDRSESIVGSVRPEVGEVLHKTSEHLNSIKQLLNSI